MSKQRFTPPTIAKKKQTDPNAVVFGRRSPPPENEEERYQRFFPGVQAAANHPPPKQAASPDQAAPSSPEPQEAAVEPAADLQATHEAELAQIFENAAQEGFQAGLTQAQEQTQALIDQHMKQMEDMLRAVVDLRRSTFEEYQEQCLELAIAGAEALARQALKHHKPALRDLLFEAMSELSGQDSVILQVGPDNAEELKTWTSERFPDRKVSVLVDPDMSPEDFRASTKTGSVTGDFQARLDKLRQMIFQHRGQLEDPPSIKKA